MFDNSFNVKYLLISICGVVLIGLIGYSIMPDIISIINDKINIFFVNLINDSV